MGYLLSLIETFKWEDTSLDRSDYIHKLNEVILESKEYDELYKTKSFNEIQLSWGNFIEFVLYYGYDSDTRKERFPWMSQTQHTTLIQIIISFKNTLSIETTELNDFKTICKSMNCNHIGFKQSAEITNYISCMDSYKEFHYNIVSGFNREERKANKKYFLKFFNAQLKVDPNQIRQIIHRNQCPRSIIRLDTPTLNSNGEKLHEELIQVHFKDKSALNIDGTWKHGNSNLSDEICNTLIDWGFMLPENLT
ncbi:hypothetical protein HNV08_00975 [Winogradskyella eckloniae]|uniref:hypothetical protein n=1 Tax=Winogradskyella eckloniae TaxID=1089306 RepID=UPI00156410DA|nr:hypothetical protein [Winogradskyella eckloniae]NRD18602.1 hypothetical protein [Winogradskyella eckloniae]